MLENAKLGQKSGQWFPGTVYKEMDWLNWLHRDTRILSVKTQRTIQQTANLIVCRDNQRNKNPKC